MILYNCNDLFNELKKIIDLPDEVISLNLIMSVGCLPQINTVSHCTKSENTDEQIVNSKIEKEFFVIEKDEYNRLIKNQMISEDETRI